MEEQKVTGSEQKEKEQKEKKRQNKRKSGKASLLFFHFLQHLSLVGAVALAVMVLLGTCVAIETKDGTEIYNISHDADTDSFEDSNMFNQMLGNSVSDLICYGAIRAQMETEGEFDPGKKVDVTAFVERYYGVSSEYITADYYLNDLIKWAQSGFQYDTASLTPREEIEFLGKQSIFRVVDLEGHSGGAIGYLNSDLKTTTREIPSVSSNQLKADDFDNDSYRTTFNLLNNRYTSAEGKNIEEYTSTWGEYNTLCGYLVNAAKDLEINYREYLTYKEYYAAENTNVVYFIRRNIGGEVQVFTNMNTKDTTLSGLSKNLKDVCDRYIYYDPHNMQYDTNTDVGETAVRYVLNGYEYAYPEDTQIMVGIDASYSQKDSFYQGKTEFGKYAPYVVQYLAGAVFCLFMYFVLLILLTAKEGRRGQRENGEAVIQLCWQDRIYTEVMLAAAALTGFGIVFVTMELVYAIWSFVNQNVIITAASIWALLVSLLFSFFYYSFVRRIKAGSLWKNSLIRKIGAAIKNLILYVYNHSTSILRVWVPFGIVILVNAGVTAFMLWGFGNSAMLATLVILVLFDGAVGYLLYRSSMSRQKILEGIGLIQEGNLEHKIKEEGMYGDDLILARAVNRIGDSVKEAVETSMKDERLKADLITNVSHDIKTPLTSIINYVDLIKRENVQDSKIREYIEVLDVKSQRLKQLTDDLVEASKISSGNIVLHWEKINLVELINQTIGEFSEKFEKKALYPVLQAPKGSVYIMADSRRIWRVIENLFNNIVKYALEGTRVYIDITVMENREAAAQVILSVKNISAQPLKVNPEELTERFIRGDESRTTEGSGLGLSIAKNLTEVQNGKFEILMDGDLFKVNMYFPLLKE